jgi:hypothetical protein
MWPIVCYADYVSQVSAANAAAKKLAKQSSLTRESGKG